MNILLAPNPILNEVSSEIKDISEYKEMLIRMKNYCIEASNCAGLSLPQVGVPKRAFVAKTSRKHMEIMINPRILNKSWIKTSLKNGEQCLSIPDAHIKIQRHYRMKIEYTTIHGEQKTTKLKGFYSIVFQHEYDHLDGILITSH